MLEISGPKPPMQGRLENTEILSNLNNGRFALVGNGDHVPAELFRTSFRHFLHPSTRESETHKLNVN